MLDVATSPPIVFDVVETRDTGHQKASSSPNTTDEICSHKPLTSASLETTRSSLEGVQNVDPNATIDSSGDGITRASKSFEQITLDVPVDIEHTLYAKESEERVAEAKDSQQGVHLSSSSCTADIQQPKLSLSQTPSAFPSPYSPLESPRPLTPPFPDLNELGLPRSTRESQRVKPETDDAFLSTTLRHPRSSSEIKFPPIPANGMDEFLQPIPFPELRRYSLVDAPAGPNIGRRTLSDIGLTSTDFLQRRSIQRTTNGATDTHSLPSSRPASRPSTARYSTFAEMGVQSFAMTKGEKTIETTAKSSKGNAKGKKKEARKRMSANVSNAPGVSPFDANSRGVIQESRVNTGPVASEHQSIDGGAEKKMIKRRNPRGNINDCIIM